MKPIKHVGSNIKNFVDHYFILEDVKVSNTKLMVLYEALNPSRPRYKNAAFTVSAQDQSSIQISFRAFRGEAIVESSYEILGYIAATINQVRSELLK